MYQQTVQETEKPAEQNIEKILLFTPHQEQLVARLAWGLPTAVMYLSRDSVCDLDALLLPANFSKT